MEARKAGAATLGGLAMLVYQGAAAFEYWTGLEAPVDVMMKAARAAL
jgi:shikimate dehydrogenase